MCKLILNFISILGLIILCCIRDSVITLYSMFTGTRYGDPNRTAHIIFNLFFPFILPLCLVSARVKYKRDTSMNRIKDKIMPIIKKAIRYAPFVSPVVRYCRCRSRGHPLPPLPTALHNKTVMESGDGGKLSWYGDTTTWLFFFKATQYIRAACRDMNGPSGHVTSGWRRTGVRADVSATTFRRLVPAGVRS